MSLKELLQPGEVVKIFFQKGNINNKTIHIRAIVDDEICVFRSWDKHKQNWRYNFFDMLYLELLYESGNLKRGKPQRS